MTINALDMSLYFVVHTFGLPGRINSLLSVFLRNFNI